MYNLRPQYFLLLLVMAGNVFAAESAAEPKRRPLISTSLSGSEVGFVQQMASSSLALHQLAERAHKTIEPGEMADFASSLNSALKEELANLKLLAAEQGMVLPNPPEKTPGGPAAALSIGEFLADVIKIRSDQLKQIQQIGGSQTASIRNFAGAMVKTIQDNLVFIQLISSREQKAAEATRKASAPAPKP